ncbi:hypothetical protein Scep_005062 [Stephania cephalantha]|uniref:PUM-HD domain-containing protein n=1 Tax=Stephania cephalantha TaxID=152367 RepID=A0AAP0KTK9_9MAGN
MGTETPLQMISDPGMGPSFRDGSVDDDLGREIELMLREQQRKDFLERERDLNIFRSGSAPPTVEGSLSAVDSLFRNSEDQFLGINRDLDANEVLSEEEIRRHPAYLSYYYSNDNFNPRLPPPLLSKEDWRVAQRFQAGTSSFGRIGDRRKDLVSDDYGKSLFSRQPGLLPTQNGMADDVVEPRRVIPRNLTRKPSAEWVDNSTDGLIGLAGVGLGGRTKSLADMLQVLTVEGLGRPTSLPRPLSRPVSRNAFDSVDSVGVTDSHGMQLHRRVDSLEVLQPRVVNPGLARVQSFGSPLTQTFSSAVGSSISRSTTPEASLIGRSTSPGLPPLGGRVGAADIKSSASSNAFSALSSNNDNHADIAAALSNLSLSNRRLVDDDAHLPSQLEQGRANQPNFFFDAPNGNTQNSAQKLIDKSGTKMLGVPSIYEELAKQNGSITDLNALNLGYDKQTNLRKKGSSAGLYTKVPSAGSLSLEGSNVHYQNPDTINSEFSGYIRSGYSSNQRINPATLNHLDAGSLDGQSLNRSGNQLGSGSPSSAGDPLYVQYLQRSVDMAAQSDPSLGRNYLGTSRSDLLGFQKAYLADLIAQQKHQYELPYLGKSGGMDHGYYGSPAFGLGMSFTGNVLANSVLPSVGPGNYIQQNERLAHFPSMIRNPTGGFIGSWDSNRGRNMEETFISSLLEEFKNNKTRSFELSDIIDHIVEFSADQYGSRFIQQKLETATVEEKNKIFPEILPHARTLMTDVFGNYVIQKFFEHGTENQRKELANQLTGHVLPLSLQMYGCRVIQKALEVVDVDQQTHLVAELDGSVMKCVRDQNGNHVIQKCIECVPQDRIQFIISAFYGQVVALSTHPYGCRVIQRVLEHCNDQNTQHIVMEEIMQAVCTLAQDQYGNYVIQHVLQHGKPHERSSIISQLAGQIVKMSQQKFASNVVEKCLSFGGPDERQILVNEMLGSTEENEPLQAMMKDPYGNYVVQKVLETCDNQNRELILSRIKIHLNALKRYTYGKHIVARVEKLITTGANQTCGTSGDKSKSMKADR